MCPWAVASDPRPCELKTTLPAWEAGLCGVSDTCHMHHVGARSTWGLRRNVWKAAWVPGPPNLKRSGRCGPKRTWRGLMLGFGAVLPVLQLPPHLRT